MCVCLPFGLVRKSSDVLTRVYFHYFGFMAGSDFWRNVYHGWVVGMAGSDILTTACRTAEVHQAGGDDDDREYDDYGDVDDDDNGG